MAINVVSVVQYNGGFLPDMIYNHGGIRLLIATRKNTHTHGIVFFCLFSLCSHLNGLTTFPPLGDAPEKDLDAFRFHLNY